MAKWLGKLMSNLNAGETTVGVISEQRTLARGVWKLLTAVRRLCYAERKGVDAVHAFG